jgi:Flp pilus assembly protein CpaB
MVLRRWPLRSKLFAGLAVACGAASFAIVHDAAAEVEALRPSGGDRVPVVVAAASLERGAALTAEGLRVQTFPSAYAPPGSVASVRDLVGRTLVTAIAEGEAVTRTRVGGAGGPVASRVASGLRAFVVTAGVPAGVLRPGDLVDVIATFGGPHPYSETVGSGLEVLEIVQDEAGTFEAGGASGPSLVLLVSPSTAERLAFATAFGTIAVAVVPVASAV